MPAHSRPILGIIYMLLAMSIVPIIDIAAKLIGDDIHVMELILARYFFQFLWLVPVFIITKEPIIKAIHQPVGQLIRGTCLVVSTIFFFLSIIDNDIPDALGLVFIAPLFATLFAPIFLGEKIGIYRISATIVGFLGSIIIINPTGNFNPSILWALGASVTFAAYYIATKKLDGRDSPLTSQIITAVVGILIAAPFMATLWTMPNGFQWLMMIIMGAASALGHYFIILAFKQADVSLLAPFDYFEIITAAAYSLIIFGTFPLPHIWVGVVVITASGLFIAYREYKIGAKSWKKTPPL